MKYTKKNKNLILEYSEFNQYQLSIDIQNPLGPGYGFATDPELSIYGQDQDSPYKDYYARTGGSLSRLQAISNNALSGILGDDFRKNYDFFIEDMDEYKNFKILRIFNNLELYLDVFISFEFKDDEFFGVFKNYNSPNKSVLKTELYNDTRYYYINGEYKIKLNGYIKNILNKWFIPKYEFYKNLKKDLNVKNNMGDYKHIKFNSIIKYIGIDTEKDGNPFIVIEQNDEKFFIKNNDYYFFNYWFEKVN